MDFLEGNCETKRVILRGREREKQPDDLWAVWKDEGAENGSSGAESIAKIQQERKSQHASAIHGRYAGDHTRMLGKMCSAEGRQVRNERPNAREDAIWYSAALRAVPGRSGFCIGRCTTPLLNSSGNLRCRPGQCKTPASPVHSYQRCRCFPGTAFPQAAPRSREDLFWLFVCRFHHASEANGGLHGETGWNILRTFSLRPLRQR